jgi:peptidoglycan/LPS O-acetylase OafA/YrhL
MPGGRFALMPVAIAILVAASVVSLRCFETPMRRVLNDAYDRHFSARNAAPTMRRRTVI